MTDIIEFLRARLDEDEQIAHDAYGGRWEVGPTFGALNNRVYVREEGDLIDSVGTCVIAGQVSNVPQFRANAQHIARWDPARVLAEVEAKRRIIALHLPLQRGKWPQSDCHPDHCSVCVEATSDYNPSVTVWPCPTLRALILSYTDHPGYDPAWTLNTV